MALCLAGRDPRLREGRLYVKARRDPLHLAVAGGRGGRGMTKGVSTAIFASAHDKDRARGMGEDFLGNAAEQ